MEGYYIKKQTNKKKYWAQCLKQNMYLINVNLHYFCYNYQGVYTWPNIKGAYILLQYRNERNTIMEVEFLIARFLDLTSISALWVYYFFFVINSENKKRTLFLFKIWWSHALAFIPAQRLHSRQCDFSAWIDGRIRSISKTAESQAQKKSHWQGPQLAKMGETKPVKRAVNTDQKNFQLKKGTCPAKVWKQKVLFGQSSVRLCMIPT